MCVYIYIYNSNIIVTPPKVHVLRKDSEHGGALELSEGRFSATTLAVGKFGALLAAGVLPSLSLYIYIYTHNLSLSLSLSLLYIYIYTCIMLICIYLSISIFQ